MHNEEFMMRRTSILVSVIALVVVGSLAVGRLSTTGAQAQASMAGHPLVGSWLVSVSLEGQAPGEGLPSDVPSLVTYFADGNVLVANSGQLPPLPPGSGLFFTEGHGQWVATGQSSAEASVVSLVLDQTGGLSSTNTAGTAVEVDASGNTYTGSITIESTSSTGGSMGGQQASVEATRIQVAPAGTPESR